MGEIVRIAPEKARVQVQSGKALLVCAYDDDEKFGRMRLEGSLPLSQFKSGISGITKDREIIFY